MAPMRRRTVWLGFSLVVLLGGIGCQRTRAPERDIFDDLQVFLGATQIVAPYARAACVAVPEDEARRACLDGVGDAETAAAEASRVLKTVEVCRERQDEECLQRSTKEAETLLPRLRRAVAPGSSSGGGK